MKRLFFLLVICLTVLEAKAQSQFISYSPMGLEDRQNSQLDGKAGVLILSSMPDLVVTVVQAPNVQSNRSPGKNSSGYYEYTVEIDCEKIPNAKLEVAKRGDVNRTSFTVNLRSNYLRAYLVEEVTQPIVLENQTTGNDAKLDASKAEIEISSTLNDLNVVCDAALEASMNKSLKANDVSVSVYTVTIPIANLTNAKDRLQTLRKQRQETEQKLLNNQNGSDAEWEKLDELEDQCDKAEEMLRRMCTIDISAKETNRISIDISDLKPRGKMCYGVLLLNKEVEVTNCNRWMREGGKLYAQTLYTDAKRAYNEALNSTDKPDGIEPIITANIALCDSCILYEQMVKFALQKAISLKQQETVSQADVANYYGTASECLHRLNEYNPTERYRLLIDKLDVFIGKLPIAMRIYTVGWMVGPVGANETGPLPNVEIWAYYGERQFAEKEYKKDRQFRKLTERSYNFRRVGVSDRSGIVDLELTRKSLPKGFFFRSTANKGDADVEYLDMQYVLAKAKGEYMKRQFRMKIYIRK